MLVLLVRKLERPHTKLYVISTGTCESIKHFSKKSRAWGREAILFG